MSRERIKSIKWNFENVLRKKQVEIVIVPEFVELEILQSSKLKDKE